MPFPGWDEFEGRTPPIWTTPPSRAFASAAIPVPKGSLAE